MVFDAFFLTVIMIEVQNTHVFLFLERHGIPYHYLCTTKENKREEEILYLFRTPIF